MRNTIEVPDERAQQGRSMYSLTRYLTARALLIVALTGCGRTSLMEPPPVALVKKVFAADMPSPAEPKATLPPVDLYMDDSKSMRGFVANPEFTYTRVVQSIFEELTTAQYPVDAISVSSMSSLHNLRRSDLIRASFYHGGDTPLTVILNRMSKDVRNGHLCVLISDLVQSEKLYDSLDIVRALQQIESAEPEILLLAFRSGFRGTYYVETAPKGRYELNVPEDTQNGRPFYILVSAPNPGDLKRFRATVLTRLGEANSFQPTASPVVIGKWRLATDADTPVYWQRKAPPEPFPGLGANAYREEFEEISGGNRRVSPLTLEIIAEFRLPFRRMDQIRYDVDYFSYKQNRPSERRLAAQFQPAAVIKRTGPKPAGNPDVSVLGPVVLRVTYPFVRPPRQSWDVYRAQMRAGDGNLGVPEWVHGWSTISDQSSANANRTLNLELIVKSMVRGITEHVVLFDHFISLGRD